ncbi:MAG: 30S ribosomal protein S6 [bacterium]
MSEKSEKKQVYEVGYHIVSSIPEENVPAQVSAIKDLLSKTEIVAEEAPKLMDLAYAIDKQIGGLRRKFDKAYFGWIKFETSPEEAVVLNKKLSAMENVLRFLLIKTVKENTLYGAKLLAEEVAKKKAVAKKEEVKEKGVASAEEIDKSIDELIKE